MNRAGAARDRLLPVTKSRLQETRTAAILAARMGSRPSRSFVLGSVGLAVLALAGCSSGSKPKPEPKTLVVGSGTVATVPKASSSTYRAEHFTFTLPAGWAEIPSTSAEAYGEPASVASIAPVGSAPSSLVVVITYDIRGLPQESADGPRAWFDWYAETNEAKITDPLHRVELAGWTAWEGALSWFDAAGNPVEVRLVRAAHGELLYLIQCAAERADRTAIAAGCETIVTSFRTVG